MEEKINYYGNALPFINAKGWTQVEFAKLLNVPKQTLNNWLKGLREPPYEILRATALLLNISIDKDILKLQQ